MYLLSKNRGVRFLNSRRSEECVGFKMVCFVFHFICNTRIHFFDQKHYSKNVSVFDRKFVLVIAL